MRLITLPLVLLISLVTILAACGGGDSDSAPEEAGTMPTSTATAADDHIEDDLASEGREVYLEVGCAQCHGQDAEGSMMAPALAGHTPEQVRRQVRNPVGMMPRFDEDDLSDEKLNSLIAYIEGLDGDHGHAFEPEAPQSTHLLMMLIALKADDLEEAQHHLGHAREYTGDAELQEQLDDLGSMLDSSDMHDAEHMIEGMLEDTDPEQGTMETLHLEIAVQALRLDDPDDARHHLEHALDADASPEATATIQEAIDAIAAGELHDAEELINTILGETNHDEG